jgi:hypothetical protein
MHDTIPQLGTFVRYTDGEGRSKPALVLGGPLDDGRLPDLSDGELHVMAFSVTGSLSVRLNIPFSDDEKPRTWQPAK